MIDVEEVEDATTDDEEIKVLPTQEWSGYWAEVKLTAQLATQLLIDNKEMKGARDIPGAVDCAYSIIEAARARVDQELEKGKECEDCGICDTCEPKSPVEPS